jgi:hypothetical protein
MDQETFDIMSDSRIHDDDVVVCRTFLLANVLVNIDRGFAMMGRTRQDCSKGLLDALANRVAMTVNDLSLFFFCGR